MTQMQPSIPVDPAVLYFQRRPGLKDITYQVEIAIALSHKDEWLAWMRTNHIRDVMATGCFKESSIIEGQTADDKTSFTISYRCETAAKLAEYLEKQAAKLRAEHTQRYEGKFTARRMFLVVGEGDKFEELPIPAA